MELSFENKTIRLICEDKDEANNLYGRAITDILIQRLADLDSAVTLNDILTGQLGEIPHAPYPYLKLDLCGGYRLVFCVNHIVIPVNDDGTLNWKVARRVKILYIEHAD